MRTAWITFEPLDAVTFRDGRPFSAGLDTLARTTLPRPSTTAGAIKAALGGAEPEAVAGPLLWREGRLFFPTPLDVVREADDLPPTRLQLLDGGEEEIVTDAPLPRLPSGAGDPCGGWIECEELGQYLCGVTPPQSVYADDALVCRERRVGLYREVGRVAEEGFLYSAEYLRPAADGLRLACRIQLRDEQQLPTGPVTVRLGGEGRQAEIGVVEAKLPDPPEHFSQGRVLLYLATPAIFANGWRPDDLGSGSLVAACLEGPEPVTGWLRGPWPPGSRWWARRAVAAGSVYFLKFKSEEAAAKFAEKNHGACLAQDKSLRFRTAGFGLCLVGTWR